MLLKVVRAKNAHYALITKTYELCSSHDALQVPNLLGVVASVCTPLPTLLAQQCWDLLRPFARSLRVLLFSVFVNFFFVRKGRDVVSYQYALWELLV